MRTNTLLKQILLNKEITLHSDNSAIIKAVVFDSKTNESTFFEDSSLSRLLNKIYSDIKKKRR